LVLFFKKELLPSFRHPPQRQPTLRTLIKVALIGSITILGACGSSEPGGVEGGAATGVTGGDVGADSGTWTTPRQVNLGPPP
jgi:hypothetical protein